MTEKSGTTEERDDKCFFVVNPNNPRWKRFECRPGVEFPHSMDGWKYCPYCGRDLEDRTPNDDDGSN